jgi:CrcB protein
MKTILYVAGGGAVGAVGRYLLGMLALQFSDGHWPWGNFSANVIGSVGLGILIAMLSLSWSPSAEVRAFLVVGLFGGFTTFSAFSFETILLFERGREDLAILYVSATLVSAIGGLFAGLRLTRMVLA